MKNIVSFILTAIIISLSYDGNAQVNKAPAYPLITHNPYFSIWSFSDQLNESTTKHWTGKPNSILGLIKVDGKVYRFLGMEDTLNTLSIQLAKQESIDMSATETKYVFTCGGVQLSLSFTSPLIINDLSILSRPVTYISMRTKSIDGKKHQTSLLVGVSSLLAANTSQQEMKANAYTSNQLNILKVGTVEQPILQKTGDNLRIDWGYAYIAANKNTSVQTIANILDVANALGSSANVSAKNTTEVKGKNLFLNTLFKEETIDEQEKNTVLQRKFKALVEIRSYYDHG
jgi:Domain of unknown function (DUF5127)/Domain of unknown function (DUF4964)